MRTIFFLLLNTALFFGARNSIATDADLSVYLSYVALVNVSYLTGVRADLKWMGRA